MFPSGEYIHLPELIDTRSPSPRESARLPRALEKLDIHATDYDLPFLMPLVAVIVASIDDKRKSLMLLVAIEVFTYLTLLF